MIALRIWCERGGDRRVAMHPTAHKLLSRIDGLVIDPQPPHVNLFHLHLPAPAAAVAKARDYLAALEGAWLAQRIGDAQVPGWSTIELYVGDNLLALDDTTVVPLYAELLAQAQAAP